MLVAANPGGVTKEKPGALKGFPAFLRSGSKGRVSDLVHWWSISIGSLDSVAFLLFEQSEAHDAEIDTRRVMRFGRSFAL